MSHGPQNLSPRRDPFDSVRRLTRTTVAHFTRAPGTVVDSSHPVVVSNSAVTVTSVILSPVAAPPQLICPSVHSCTWHCPEDVTVVAAVVFVPLSTVDSVSSASVPALYCVIP